MTTTPIALPELSDGAVDRIEEAVFTQIAEERHSAQARSAASRGRARRRGWLTAGGIAAAFVVGVLVTPPILHLSGSASGSSVTSAPYDAAPGARPLTGATKDLAQTGAGTTTAGGSASSTTAQRDIIRTGTATVHVTDVRRAADALAELAQKHGGFVESQQIGSSRAPASADGIVPAPVGDGWVTLRVPAADLPAVMDALRSEGTVLATSIGQNDVTATTTDLHAQVDSLTASVQRLTQLMSQATSVSDLLTAETALTERQGQLQSAQQQLKDLESQVDMSSVQVTLVRQAPAAADPAGFGDGLAAGWQGLIVSLNALVIALGFLLPWLVVAAVVVLLVWGVVRIRRAGRARRAAPPAD